MLIPTSRELLLRKNFCAALDTNDVIKRLTHDIRDDRDLQAFYSSQVLLRLPPEHCKSLLQWLKSRFNDEGNRSKVLFLETELPRLWKWEAILTAAGNGLHVEDIVNYFEYLLARARHLRVGVDGNEYDEEVIDSQHEHQAAVFSDAIRLIFQTGIQPSGRKKGRPRKCQSFGFALGRRRAIRSTIIEVLMGAFIPMSPSRARELALIPDSLDCSCFLAHSPDYWGRLEVYRDLNIGHRLNKAAPSSVLQELLIESGMVSSGPVPSTARLDVTKAGHAAHALKFHNIGQVLEAIYGASNTAFIYRNREYTIGDIIDVAKKISLAAEQMEAATSEGIRPLGSFHVMGRRSLIRFLNVTDNESELIDLFCADGGDDSDPRFMPLVHVGPAYYVVPSLILNQSYDKVVDKILSRTAVTLKDGNNLKGGTFEAELERCIRAAGYKWGRTNRDQKKGVPEVDGAFLLSEKTLVVYEAKCSVKPEERTDAYRFVENHLVRALDQLAKRILYLRSSADDAGRRLGFSIEGCEIIPLLLTNHPYFTGLEAVTPDGDEVHIVDHDLFDHIIARRLIPSWNYDTEKGAYVRTELPLETDEAVVEAIKRPWANLVSVGPSFIQVAEGQIAYTISTTPVFDDLPI